MTHSTGLWLLLCWIFYAGPLNEHAFGWGNTAHRIINRDAVLHLPSSMQQLVNQRSYLADHASDADYRKSSDTAEYPKHYLDLETYPDFSQLPPQLGLVVQQYGWSTVKANGILPWATAWAVDSLVVQARRGDMTKVYQTAADIGHYIGDAFQPLHCTINYDGKLTGNDGIHSRYESSMINQYQTALSVSAQPLHLVADPYVYVCNLIIGSNALVDSILRADNAAKVASGWSGSGTVPAAYYAALWQRVGPMTAQLVQDATIAVASLWQYAWMQAGLIDPLAVTGAVTLPGTATLLQNYPNPFNSSTSIPFTVAQSGPTRITIRTLLGQEIAVLYDGIATAGEMHQVRFDAGHLATGVYLYELHNAGRSQVRRLLHLR